MRSVYLCFLGLLTIVGACTKSGLGAQEVAGTYHIKFPHGSETLVLAESGEFTQIYQRVEDRRSITNAGKWEVDKQFDTVVLHGAVLFDDRQGRQSPTFEKTVWSIGIIKRFSTISLQVDSDGALEYQKAQKP